MSSSQEQPAVVIVSAETIDDTFTAVQTTTIDDFRRQEYLRLASAQDPAEHMLMSAFGILIGNAGDKNAMSFLVGGFIVTRSLYTEAANQGLVLRRPDPALVAPQVDAIARAFDPAKQFEISGIYDEFPQQQALCGAINGLRSSATRVGALTMMGVYAHHLIEPGHKMTIRIGDVALPGTPESSPAVQVSPIE
jgi:hypothetical protein